MLYNTNGRDNKKKQKDKRVEYQKLWYMPMTYLYRN